MSDQSLTPTELGTLAAIESMKAEVGAVNKRVKTVMWLSIATIVLVGVTLVASLVPRVMGVGFGVAPRGFQPGAMQQQGGTRQP